MFVSKILIFITFIFVAYKIYQKKQNEENDKILNGYINQVFLEKGQQFEFTPYEDNKIYIVEDIDFYNKVVWLKDNTDETTELHFLDLAKYYKAYIG
tara:strand:- start:14524 stop:14814 length:291 start_codon:yes stop_codon:yes gene_type:complete